MSIESKFQKDYILAPLTTFRIGGPAKYFLEVREKEELSEAINWCKQNGENFFILGGGSNVLISDAGIDGLVLRLLNDEIAIKGERFDCGAGASLPRAVNLSIANSLSGLEWGIGIPGTIGGAVRGNAGGFGISVEDIVETVEIYSVKTGKFYKISPRDCEFGYRESIFKKNSDLIIWQIILRLKQESLDSIRQTIEKNQKARQTSQPKLPSAGCIFKNFPLESLKSDNPELAREAIDSGQGKTGLVSAGWLIEKLDLKGKAIGGAKVSLEHANFIVNTGRATAAEIVMLASLIKQRARTELKIQLREEIQYFGF